MSEKTIVNKKHKDRLFRRLFQEKKDLLDLYNAVNQTDYTDPEALEINTLDDAIYMTMKNDLSFLISGELHLYEHQSTFNPNMPYRDLDYILRLWRGHVAKYQMDIYGSRAIQIPTPTAIVFYNGKKDLPERTEQKLSDLFTVKQKEACLEMKVQVLNINYGKNRRMMERCQKLEEYSFFISRIRFYEEEGIPMVEAVDRAIEESIGKGVLAEFLRKNRDEVRDMILTEYNEQKHIENEKKWSYEEGLQLGEEIGEARGRQLGEEIGETRGRQLGEKIGKMQAIKDMIMRLSQKKEISLKEAMEMLDIPEEYQNEYLDLIKSNDNK
ncbi:MAG: hypothetical protein ACI4E3_05415 [Candidatus Fimousia sp.]